MRLALLGSPGIGIQRRLSRHMITGTPARFVGDPAATYAAVVANHHLDIQVYRPGFGLVTEVVVFAGTENTRALFIAAINAQAKKFIASANGLTSIQFDTRMLGSLAEATILNTTSADVIASLGLGVLPAAFDPSFGVRMIGKRNWGRANVMYTGGRKPVIDQEDQSALQHAVALRVRTGVQLVVDRQTLRTVASDSVHFTPVRDPGAE